MKKKILGQRSQDKIYTFIYNFQHYAKLDIYIILILSDKHFWLLPVLTIFSINKGLYSM